MRVLKMYFISNINKSSGSKMTIWWLLQNKSLCVVPVCSCMCNILCNGHNDNPVCGSDGVTYDTPCHVREASCHKQLKIDIKHVGRCQGNHLKHAEIPTNHEVKDLKPGLRSWTLKLGQAKSEIFIKKTVCVSDKTRKDDGSKSKPDIYGETTSPDGTFAVF